MEQNEAMSGDVGVGAGNRVDGRVMSVLASKGNVARPCSQHTWRALRRYEARVKHEERISQLRIQFTITQLEVKRLEDKNASLQLALRLQLAERQRDAELSKSRQAELERKDVDKLAQILQLEQRLAELRTEAELTKSRQAEWERNDRDKTAKIFQVEKQLSELQKEAELNKSRQAECERQVVDKNAQILQLEQQFAEVPQIQLSEKAASKPHVSVQEQVVPVPRGVTQEVVKQVPTREERDHSSRENSTGPVRFCHTCRARNAGLRCGKCKAVYFCGKECQSLGWKSHKLQCREQIVQTQDPESMKNDCFTMDDLSGADLRGKRVLIRCDLNVPIKYEQITASARIGSSWKAIKYLADNGAKVIACPHVDRPKGWPNEKLPLTPVAKYLGKLTGKVIPCAPDCKDTNEVKAVVDGMSDGDLMLLANTCLQTGESKEDDELVKSMASIADIYVNDAFGRRPIVGELRNCAVDAEGRVMVRHTFTAQKADDDSDDDLDFQKLSNVGF